MSRKLTIGLLLAVGVIGILAILLFYRQQDLRYVSTDNAIVDGNQVAVSATILGRLVQVKAAPGDRVSTGEILATLDSAALSDRLDQARVKVEEASQAAQLAQVHLAGALSDLGRADAQLKAGAISRQRYDEVKTAAAEAQTRVDQAESRRKAAEAAERAATDTLADATLKSPLDGVVAKKWRSAGDVVTPGQTIFSLYDLKDEWVSANIDETRIRLVHPGQPVTINADALPDKTFTGRVERVGATTADHFSPIAPSGGASNFSKQMQRIAVRITLDDPGSTKGTRLVPGMSVRIRIDIAHAGT